MCTPFVTKVCVIRSNSQKIYFMIQNTFPTHVTEAFCITIDQQKTVYSNEISQTLIFGHQRAPEY